MRENVGLPFRLWCGTPHKSSKPSPVLRRRRVARGGSVALSDSCLPRRGYCEASTTCWWVWRPGGPSPAPSLPWVEGWHPEAVNSVVHYGAIQHDSHRNITAISHCHFITAGHPRCPVEKLFRSLTQLYL